MVQSIELLLDDAAERAVTDEWELLHATGLPSARRPEPVGSHRPHITLLAAEVISDEAERALPRLMSGLDLDVGIGSPLCFTRRRRGETNVILVRQIVTSVELLRLQQAVTELCGTGLGGDFAPGRWTPHVTLGSRYRPDQVGSALDLLAGQETTAERDAVITRCRRWDGEAKRDWLL